MSLAEDEFAARRLVQKAARVSLIFPDALRAGPKARSFQEHFLLDDNLRLFVKFINRSNFISITYGQWRRSPAWNARSAVLRRVLLILPRSEITAEILWPGT